MVSQVLYAHIKAVHAKALCGGKSRGLEALLLGFPHGHGSLGLASLFDDGMMLHSLDSKVE